MFVTDILEILCVKLFQNWTMRRASRSAFPHGQVATRRAFTVVLINCVNGRGRILQMETCSCLLRRTSVSLPSNIQHCAATKTVEKAATEMRDDSALRLPFL